MLTKNATKISVSHVRFVTFVKFVKCLAIISYASVELNAKLTSQGIVNI